MEILNLTFDEKQDLLLLLNRNIKELQDRLNGLLTESNNIYINDLKKSLPVNIARYNSIVDKIQISFGYQPKPVNIGSLYTDYSIAYSRANGTTDGCMTLNEFAAQVKGGMNPLATLSNKQLITT